MPFRGISAGWRNALTSTYEVHKEQCKCLHLGRNSPMHQNMLRGIQLESSLTEEALEVLVDIKWNMSQQCAAKKAWDALIRMLPAGQGDPSLSTAQATPGIVSSSELHSGIENMNILEHPTIGHEKYKGTEAWFL